MKKVFVITSIASLVILLCTFSCSTPTNISQTNLKSVNTSNTSTTLNNHSVRNISGKAVFPETRKEQSKFNVKAIPSEVSTVSTISVIIPSDTTLNPNKTIATGLTDINGNFSIDMTGVTLVNNAVYVLEASKRLSDTDLLTIRSYIRWNGSAWESITIGDTIIDENTTALSVISSFNPLTVPNNEVIGKLPIESGKAKPVDVNNNLSQIIVAKDDIVNVSKLTNSILQGGRDPIALLKFNISKPYKYFIDQTINFYQVAAKNGCPGCSFIGGNIKGSKVSLAGKDLSYADLTGQDLTGVDLSGTILIGADLSDAILPDDLSYLNLTGVNLSGQDLRNTNLTGTNFLYANLTNCNLSGTSGALKDLSKVRLSGADFTNADITYTNLSKVNLFEAVFKNTKLANSDFSKADLTGVDMEFVFNKDITGVKLTEANLKGANFSGLDLQNNDIVNAGMEGTNFSGAFLQNKNFQGYNFSGTNFSGAHLDNVVFNNAKMANIDLSKWGI